MRMIAVAAPLGWHSSVAYSTVSNHQFRSYQSDKMGKQFTIEDLHRFELTDKQRYAVRRLFSNVIWVERNPEDPSQDGDLDPVDLVQEALRRHLVAKATWGPSKPDVDGGATRASLLAIEKAARALQCGLADYEALRPGLHGEPLNELAAEMARQSGGGQNVGDHNANRFAAKIARGIFNTRAQIQHFEEAKAVVAAIGHAATTLMRPLQDPPGWTILVRELERLVTFELHDQAEKLAEHRKRPAAPKGLLVVLFTQCIEILREAGLPANEGANCARDVRNALAKLKVKHDEDLLALKALRTS